MKKIAAPNRPEVRDRVTYQVKIKDADLLGEAINEISSSRTTKNIDAYGRGFRVPDASENVATIYSSTVILADQAAAPKGEYIYTMEDVIFRTEIQVEGKDNKFIEKDSDVKLNGGWVLQNGEYVLVIFCKKKDAVKITDYQKMQGRVFYNAVFTRYVTGAIGADILRARNFSHRETANDNPDIRGAFVPAQQKVIDKHRGIKSTEAPAGGRDFNNLAPGGEPAGNAKAPESKAPDFVKKNYYLYDRKSADILFGYKDPTSKAPFNKATDPVIDFHFNFPNFVKENNQDFSENPNAGDVEVAFTNVPSNMPHEIFGNIYDYLKNGLDAKELSAGTDVVYGNTNYNPGPDQGQQTLLQKNAQKISDLLNRIDALQIENKEYRVDFDENRPSEYKAKGVKKNIVFFLNELKAYVRNLEKNLPLSLAELDELIKVKGEYAVNPKKVNLLKILKTK